MHLFYKEMLWTSSVEVLLWRPAMEHSKPQARQLADGAICSGEYVVVHGGLGNMV